MEPISAVKSFAHGVNLKKCGIAARVETATEISNLVVKLKQMLQIGRAHV